MISYIIQELSYLKNEWEQKMSERTQNIVSVAKHCWQIYRHW